MTAPAGVGRWLDAICRALGRAGREAAEGASPPEKHQWAGGWDHQNPSRAAAKRKPRSVSPFVVLRMQHRAEWPKAQRPPFVMFLDGPPGLRYTRLVQKSSVNLDR